MNGCIVYYSYNGNNRILAEELQRRLGCQIHEVLELRKRGKFSILLDAIVKKNRPICTSHIDLTAYSFVIVVAPIWFQQIALPMQTFLRAHKDEINALYFISLCNGVLGQKSALDAGLTKLMGRIQIQTKQIWVNELLPEHKKNVRESFAYQMSQEDIATFDDEIVEFIDSINELTQ